MVVKTMTMMMVVTTVVLVATMVDDVCTDMKARSAPVELLIAVLQPDKNTKCDNKAGIFGNIGANKQTRPDVLFWGQKL